MPAIPTVIHFEGLKLASSDDIVEHLRKGTTTRAQDSHPFDWAMRFAAESASNHALMGEAIKAIVERAVNEGQQRDASVGTVIRLASNAKVYTHGPALLRWLDSDTDAWSDAQVKGYLGQLFSVGDTALPNEGTERIRALALRPSCFDTGLAVLLANWPWDAATLIGTGAAAAWSRGETEVATGLTSIWNLECLAYRAELVHAVMSFAPALQAAQRDAMHARFSADRLAEFKGVMAACAGGEAPETTTMARRLVEVFGAFTRSGYPSAAALVIHPRDLDPHPWAAQAERDQEALARYLDSAQGGAKPATIGDPQVALSVDQAALLSLALEPATSAAGKEMLVYRIDHRFKIGLERSA